MVKGRNTIVVSTRVPDQLYEAIEMAANQKHMTISEYIKLALWERPELQRVMVKRAL